MNRLFFCLFNIGSIIIGCNQTENAKIRSNNDTLLIDTLKASHKEKIAERKIPVSAHILFYKSGCLYLNYGNPIDVSVPGFKASEIDIEATNAKVIRKGSSFTVKPDSLKIVEIRIFAKNNLVSTKHISVIKLPKPTPKLGYFKGKVIKKENLLKTNGLRAERPSYFDMYSAKIIVFNLSCRIDGFEETAKSNGSRFSEEQIAIMKKFRSGQKFYFEDIVAETQDGFVHDLGAMKFIIE